MEQVGSKQEAASFFNNNKTMARIDKNKFLSGAIGDLVFRNLDGKQVVQSKPDGVKQSRLTKLSGNEFRNCSKWAKMLRYNLNDFLAQQTDGYMYRRFTGQLYKALQSNTSLMKGERTPLNCHLEALVKAAWAAITASPVCAFSST